ncbi:hypothetical protein KSB_16470 [Ktedonobacter robiniae]|uniref:histidine kinase n=1 Tax=Ktedonobacter robiniae TaxID=2778365 RepID=A0ABQ3UL98_9CHLR|nr:hypothetical protein KSB_16470 [Ktedonobacter robiniae]
MTYGCAEGTVDAGGSIGPIYRYALVVQDPQGNGYIGIIVTGRSIKAQADALSPLLNLLLGIGGGALLCAGLGGLFLANRALIPARLAWSNQQRFLADASHELRTPLTLLRADAEVLLRGRTHMQQEDISILEDILAETHHMTTITTNMLTLARLDSHQSHREHEVIDIAALTRRVMQRIHAFAEQRDITLEEQLTNNIHIIGDSNLLEQAILALLDNAVKYNKPNGKICVSTSIQHEAVHLKVHDTGIGVSTEHLPHLGERFYRVDKARSRQAGGTGLGLSIARSITVEHGGQLTLVSIPGQGTTATLVLPMARETPLAHKEALPTRTASRN